MSRPRTPTNVLELRGSFKRNPQRGRARINEPEPAGDIGDPPEHLTAVERGCWVELVGLCHEGVLCAADRPFLEYGARVFAQLRADPFIDTKLATRFETICGRLGMTPADRSKVQISRSARAKDPYSEFGTPEG